ncbi:hypothetical protein BJI45_00740 [Limosilactobacillus reuteri]|uniref:Type II toxin-antitoxin system RelE/ParE family toxin n=1 Tax=Limosilactobacillus reuteri TaxID=1598 RepID=A0AB36I535_LIMRT|nr:hypothetical protein BJI45_00670 [Limosilactobacillus reuteri]OJI11635.1 hypothetical protein BJI45_00740 [Limosilactobacillus reuteri]
MKNYKVRLRGAAKRDVKVLNRYLIRNFSESKVNEVLTSLQESITRLGRMPNLVRDARELSSFVNQPVLKKSKQFVKNVLINYEIFVRNE